MQTKTFQQETSRTQGTERDYTIRADAKLKEYRDQSGLRIRDIEGGAFVQWLEAFRDGISAAYWRRTRAALVFRLGVLGRRDLAELVSEISTEGCRPANATSAHKKKSVSDSEIRELSAYLGSEPVTEIERRTLNFFLANLIVGLRPVEWFQAKLFVNGIEASPHTLPATADVDVDDIKLVVNNAKNTNGRAHGPTRTLHLKNLSPDEAVVLFAHWRYVAQIGDLDEYKLFQRQCSAKLRYACTAIWPYRKRRPTLYSTRHQSIADAKNSLPLAEIAALYGHATDRTATEHYGRRRYGKAGRSRLAAEPEEVDRVRQIPKTWTPPSRSRGVERK